MILRRPRPDSTKSKEVTSFKDKSDDPLCNARIVQNAHTNVSKTVLR